LPALDLRAPHVVCLRPPEIVESFDRRERQQAAGTSEPEPQQ
jgi:hypothetical protein